MRRIANFYYEKSKNANNQQLYTLDKICQIHPAKNPNDSELIYFRFLKPVN